MARRNPPRDIDSPEMLGGECVIWALAAISGQSVPSVRRAAIHSDFDIWTDDGKATGMPQHQWRTLLDHLGLTRRLIDIVRFPWNDRKVVGAQLRGRGRTRNVAQKVRGKPTVGQLVKACRRDGVACLMVLKTDGGRSTHMVGYSPQDGYKDSMVPWTFIEEIHDPGEKIPRAMVAGKWYEIAMNTAKKVKREAEVRGKKDYERPFDDPEWDVFDSVKWRPIPRMKSRPTVVARFYEHVGAAGRDVEDIVKKYPAGESIFSRRRY